MSQEKVSLHGYLGSIREANGYFLRHVERETGISNAYLSQIEGGRIRQPSPSILYKLSRLYGVSYSTLMALADHPALAEEPEDPSIKAIRRIGPVTAEEADALLEYLQFLRSRQASRR